MKGGGDTYQDSNKYADNQYKVASTFILKIWVPYVMVYAKGNGRATYK